MNAALLGSSGRTRACVATAPSRASKNQLLAAASLPKSPAVQAITIILEPATKVIGKMRGVFPKSILVGWKYELIGARNDALLKAARQIEENHTEACVLNGRAFGPGFAFCQPDHAPREISDKAELIRHLTVWLKSAAKAETRTAM